MRPPMVLKGSMDRLIFTPDDVDLARSPLRRGIAAGTYVLGAFNPGFTRLESGNLLMMVRVAEALRDPVRDGHVHAIRWTPAGYVLDAYPLDQVDMRDPRQFDLAGRAQRILGLTSLSWLLPVELDPTGTDIVAVHYDRAIEPAASYQEYGVEDPRISRVGDRWYMTTCSVGAERHGTTLHVSRDGLNYDLAGLVLDHQNKDMLLFEGTVGDGFMAMTRPLGDCYFAYPPDSEFLGGPSINFASSPDALHWRPLAAPGIRARKGAAGAAKVGGGSPPILTDAGWLTIWHGVEAAAAVGIYRSFWALMDRDDPTRFLHVEDQLPILEANPALTAPIAHQLYLPTPVVFTTGMIDMGDHYLVASGEADLACRLTRIDKSRFA
jgi:beta-1,2-mannobiose phosphorylase / 1,2-beta-oligomannan phosphorylase